MRHDDPQADLRKFVRDASHRAEKIFRRKRELFPMWHVVRADGTVMLLPQPSPDKNFTIAMIKALFTTIPVRRYVYIDEAWSAVAESEEDARRDEDLSMRPDREEVVIFSAEYVQLGSLTAVRKIVRPPGRRPRLGSLEFLDLVEGRFAGLLPRTGGLQ
jgi:hypothetical protein